jgi:beta-lactamase class A
VISDDFIIGLEQKYGGKLHIFFRDLQTSDSVEHRADEKVSTASVIKLPILIHVALAVQEGYCDWNESLTLTEEVKRGGTGILFGLTPGLQLPLRDACYLMIVLSDNTATNLIIDRFGIAPINARMRELGLPHSTLFRKAFSPETPESQPYGLGVTTAREMGELLIRLAQKKIGNEEVSADILTILCAQQDRAAIPRYLPSDWQYAGKTGCIDHLRADVGIVTAPDGRQYILALFCSEIPMINWTVDNPGLLAIAQLARSLLIPNAHPN